jgi:hypothetical protein
MTIRVKIENLPGNNGVILIDKGGAVHLALRPGEVIEDYIWDGQPIKIVELTDATRTDILWLPSRGV